ncbi:MAG TPA: hypothetical protein VGM63_17955, partial [Mucilaginibacter sp.]
FAMVPLLAGQVYYNYLLNICGNGFILWLFTMTPIAKLKPTVVQNSATATTASSNEGNQAADIG